MPARVESSNFLGKDFAQASRRLDVRYYLVAILFTLLSPGIAGHFSRVAARSGVEDFLFILAAISVNANARMNVRMVPA